MTTLIDHQSINLATGTRTIGPVDIADGINTIEFRIARCTTATPTFWPNASTTLTLAIEVSYDGGASWNFESSVNGIHGGIEPGLHGVTERADDFLILTGLPQTSGRKLRGQLQIANGPLVSQFTVNVE